MKTLLTVLLVAVTGCSTAVLREPEIDITDNVRACKGLVKVKKFVVDQHQSCSCKNNVIQTNVRIKTYFEERPLYRKMHRFVIYDNSDTHGRGTLVAIMFILCNETSLDIEKPPTPAMETKD